MTIAFVIPYLFSDSLGTELFAWPVTPTMSSLMLGATYLGGAYFFVVVLCLRAWRHVWLGFLPIIVFAGTLGLATLLHWDRFVHDRLGFQLWALLYFTVPLVLPVLWYRNQQAAGVDRRGTLSSPSRWGFAVQGVVLTVAGLLLFVVPELMATIWPWTITALTGRLMAAIFLLPGLVGLSIAYDGSWSGTRRAHHSLTGPPVRRVTSRYASKGNAPGRSSSYPISPANPSDSPEGRCSSTANVLESAPRRAYSRFGVREGSVGATGKRVRLGAIR